MIGAAVVGAPHDRSSTPDGSGSADGVETVVVDDGGTPVPAGELPARLGRYVVVEQIGAGGMGRVLRAYDPKLRREVALKLLAARAHGPEGAARIVREAHAMARLSHPNLVAVYDVEEGGDALFLVMEYLDGDTLRAWLAAATRSLAEVLAVFVAAGRGLAAAHAAGLVHRDFKPDNVMVGRAGPRQQPSVHVVDFGVARELAAGRDVGADEPRGVGEDALTQAGTVIGTLAYMAPEQHRGELAGPASDQYGFCVALYEALVGTRPFRGADADALLQAKLRGVGELPSTSGKEVPRWLRLAVQRGLAPDPAQRWPSMEALLAVLEGGQLRARRRRGLAVAAALALVVGGAVGLGEVERRRTIRACAQDGDGIDEVWNDDARARVRDALVATGVRYAATTADRVLPWLDGQAAAWRQARSESCAAARVEARWDEPTLERARWCLDERRMELAALVDELSRADATVVQRAVGAAAGLTDVDGCRDAARLARLPAPPRDGVDEIQAVRVELSRAWGLERAGKYREGLAAAEAAVAGADALGWPPLSAAARHRQAALASREGDYAQAERLATQAYFAAAHIDAWDTAADAATLLTFVVGERLARTADGLTWGEHARVALVHTADGEGLREAARLAELAAVHNRAGDYALARALHEDALAIKERAFGPDHPSLAAGLNNLALVYFATGDYEGASALHRRVLAIREQALGPDHPELASSLGNLANARYLLGEVAEALALHERALAITEAALGPDHPKVAASLGNVASMREAMGDRVEAMALHRRTLAIFERALGPDHPDVAAALSNLAAVRAEEGDVAGARADFERALAIREQALGPEHPDVAIALASVAWVYALAGESALQLARLERAVAIYDRHEGEQPGELEARFSLAEALTGAGPASPRALALATAVQAGLRAAGAGKAETLAAVDAWLAAHAR